MSPLNSNVVCIACKRQNIGTGITSVGILIGATTPCLRLLVYCRNYKDDSSVISIIVVVVLVSMQVQRFEDPWNDNATILVDGIIIKFGGFVRGCSDI